MAVETRPRVLTALKMKLTPKQEEYLQRPERYLLAEGGKRAGKSWIALVAAIMHSLMEPRNYWLICRYTMPSLAESSLKTFKEDVLPAFGRLQDFVEYRPSEEKFILPGNSVIKFSGLDELFKLGSMQFGGVLFEEATDHPQGEEAITELGFRLSLGRIKHRRLLPVSNPAGYTHLWRDFINEETRKTGYGHVHFTIYDNRENLPLGFIEEQEGRFPPGTIEYRRYLMGEWGLWEGLAFPEFDPSVHVIRSFDPPPGWRRTLSLDHGLNAPTCAHWVCCDPDGFMYAYREYHQAEKMPSEHAPMIAKLSGDEQISTRVIDPSCTQRTWKGGTTIVDEYALNGLHFMPGNRDRKAGYVRVRELLRIREWPDGTRRPILRIMDNCPVLLQQLRMLEHENEEVKTTRRDDAYDSIRYNALTWPRPSSPITTARELPADAPIRVFQQAEEARQRAAMVL